MRIEIISCLHLTFAACATFLVMPTRVAAQVDARTKQALLTEALPIWKTPRPDFGVVCASKTTVNFGEKEQDERVQMLESYSYFRKRTVWSDSSRNEYLIQKEFYKTNQMEGPPSSIGRFVSNLDHAFYVRRPIEEKNFTFIRGVRREDLVSDLPMSAFHIFQSEYELVWWMDADRRVFGVLLVELMTSPDFILVLASPRASPDGKFNRFIRVEFQYLRQARGNYRFPSGRYWAILNSENDWRVRQGGVFFDESFVVEYTFSIMYQADEKFRPYDVSRIRYKRKSLNDQAFDETEIQITEILKTSPFRVAEFRLQYYGIPESKLQEPSRPLP